MKDQHTIYEFQSEHYKGGSDKTDDQIFWFTGNRDNVFALATRLRLNYVGTFFSKITDGIDAHVS